MVEDACIPFAGLEPEVPLPEFDAVPDEHPAITIATTIMRTTSATEALPLRKDSEKRYTVVSSLKERRFAYLWKSLPIVVHQ